MPDPTEKNDAREVEQASDSKIDTAFIQVPVAIREEVQGYIKDLMAGSGSDLSTTDDITKSLPDQGCFLVISLNKIEEILNGLKSCLAMEPDNGARNIKSEIQRTLKLLS